MIGRIESNVTSSNEQEKIDRSPSDAWRLTRFAWVDGPFHAHTVNKHLSIVNGGIGIGSHWPSFLFDLATGKESVFL